MLYCDGNTIVSALEILHQLLLSVNAEFEQWLLSACESNQAIKLNSFIITQSILVLHFVTQTVTNFWANSDDSSVDHASSDMQSLTEVSVLIIV